MSGDPLVTQPGPRRCDRPFPLKDEFGSPGALLCQLTRDHLGLHAFSGDWEADTRQRTLTGDRTMFVRRFYCVSWSEQHYVDPYLRAPHPATQEATNG